MPVSRGDRTMKLSGFTDEISPDFEVQLQSAQKLGLRFISLRSVDGVNIGQCSREYINTRVLPLLRKYHIGVSSLAAPLGKVQLDQPDQVAGQMDMARRMAEFADMLECQFVRVFGFYLPEGVKPELFRTEVVERLGEITKILTDGGVMPVLENEKELYADTTERCLDVLRALQPQLGMIFDPANFVQVGCDSMEAFCVLQPYVRYVHIKDAQAGSGHNVLCGTGDGKIKELLQRLRTQGYRGFLTLEPHLTVFDALAQLERGDADKYVDRASDASPYELFQQQADAVRQIIGNWEE